MQAHFKQTAEKLLPHARGGLVVELGSNDGIMLEAWQDLKVTAIGLEPSKNVADVSRSRGHRVIQKFMDDNVVNEILTYGDPSVVFAANTFCQFADFSKYLGYVTELIGQNGIFVFEDPYFLDIVDKTSYDQIYDEHVWYFTVSFVNNLLAPLGYHVFDCEHIEVHGGELRMYVGHRDTYPAKPAVAYWLGKERDLAGKLEFFSANIKKSKSELLAILLNLKRSGKKICGFGAASKGTTITNYCGIGPDLIPFVTDNTPIKQGKYYPGSHIPVVPQERFNKDIDVAVLFAWNHFKEISQSQPWFKEKGGRWITHVPWPHLI